MNGSRLRGLAGRGYSLVALMVLIAVLGIMVGMITPVIEHAQRRQLEEETIFRGLQYAEAIRVFQARQGRPPTSLEELLETQPRSIRQLWRNPLSPDGAWGILNAADPTGQAGGGDGEDEEEEGEETSRFSLAGRKVSTGPVLGVYAKGSGVPIRSFNGAEVYKEWRFTADLVPKPAVSTDGEFVARANAANVGRPFLYGMAGPGLQALEGQDLGGGEGPSDLFGQGESPDAFGSRLGGDDADAEDDDEDDG